MKRKIALALGSGGARGWSHIGVIKTLEAEGIVPDIVCGTSMGALVGGAYVSGALAELEDFARSLTQVSMVRLADVNVTTGGLIEGDVIANQLRSLGYKKRFDQLERPFLAVASDLFEQREVWLREGDLLNAIRASIAIPGIFSPVFHDGRWLMDGGMTNPVPVSACRALGADIVIAVNPDSKIYADTRRWSEPVPEKTEQVPDWLSATPPALRPYLKSVFARDRKAGPRPPDYFTVLAAAIDLMTDQIRRSRMAGEPPHVLVNIKMHHRTILDFNCADEAIAAGRTAMQENMHFLNAYL